MNARPHTWKDNYREVRAAAQALANELGFDHGIEKDAFGYRFFMLPERQNRYGFELRCEIVVCENAVACQKGHGYR